MTYGLAIHTGSPELGFAIDNFQGDRRSAAWDLGRDASNQLHDRLQEFLPPQTWQDLAFIAVAIGPGGFTGTRLGVVLARTLAQQLDRPLFGVSSLQAIADATAQAHPTATPIAVQMPAQRGELYGGIYAIANPPPHPAKFADQVIHPEVWQTTLAQFPDATLVEAIALQGRYAPNLLTIAQAQWQAGLRPHWSSVLPYYGQHPVQT
jgi:tRNA threonylcarbamoyl adenosine modification protein YeaZ